MLIMESEFLGSSYLIKSLYSESTPTGFPWHGIEKDVIINKTDAVSRTATFAVGFIRNLPVSLPAIPAHARRKSCTPARIRLRSRLCV